MKSPFHFSPLPMLLAILFSCSDSSNDDMEEGGYTVSGTITGDNVDEVIILVNGEHVGTTNSIGYFSVPLLAPNVNTISPQKQGLIFDPLSQIIDGDMSVENVDFVASTDPMGTQGLTIDGENFVVFNSSVFDIVANVDNSLRLDLAENAIWYHNGQAGLVYTEIAGDFIVSARVSAQKSSDNEQVAECNVCLGGLMARNPDNLSGENYVHMVVGVNPVGVGVETKNTLNGNSDFTPTDDGSASYEVQMERSGSTFTLSKRAVGQASWVLATSYEREDLPDLLQVGMNIYTSVGGSEVADLSVLFENINLEIKE